MIILYNANNITLCVSFKLSGYKLIMNYKKSILLVLSLFFAILSFVLFIAAIVYLALGKESESDYSYSMIRIYPITLLPPNFDGGKYSYQMSSNCIYVSDVPLNYTMIDLCQDMSYLNNLCSNICPTKSEQQKTETIIGFVFMFVGLVLCFACVPLHFYAKDMNDNNNGINNVV